MASSIIDLSSAGTPQSADSSFDMAETPAEFEGLSALHSLRSTHRLEQIAELRARGIGDHIDLPQLVVCGDQSAGKSSVLEGITGIPFPRKDGVCTKFATEIILQNSKNDLSIVATILPAASRSDKSKDAIRNYKKELKSVEELPTAIAEAGMLMGIRGFGEIQAGPAFAEDVLRIDVSGPVGLHLSVVDLPGLISVANEEQTDDDVDLVQKLVDGYVANPRTIILAVVQASNDIANQGIIQKSRTHDKRGTRTVGIITKPDLINQGAEGRIALLAKNQDTTKLKLGYFLIKNPSPTELASGITAAERQKSELRYFQSAPWKDQHLDVERVGILSLQMYLQTLLDRHVERELPKVRSEIEKLLDRTAQEILSLGEERPTAAHCRIYLSRLAMQFHGLITSALNGTYHESDARFFAADQLEESSRLRALLHTWNTDFSNTMRTQGEKRKVIECSPDEDEGADEESDGGTDTDSHNPQLEVSSSNMKEWVREV
jgi:GTPase SAR1 family protein